MSNPQTNLPPGDDEIDLLEMFAAAQRRWRWVFGGGLLGLALAVGAVSSKPRLAPQVQSGLILDVAQGPCFSRSRQQSVFKESSVERFSCYSEIQSVRQALIRLVKNSSLLPSLNDSIAAL
ncbi:hypothetical protein [Synechococcus sp. N5]|uniref:hypothetical protein n=1 Tax=Synechococcus sp. N5 TaxID=2575515 RepID=UPI0010BD8E93|nr:hypothetical protein [Synechococcus sp. N5]